MRILVLGATGMLGFQIFKSCLDRSIIVNAVVRNKEILVKRLGEKCENKIHVIEDIKNVDAIEQIIQSFNPEYLINCVGIIKQSSLADDPYESIAINSFLPHQLARLGQSHNFKLIHISTDCVFDGKVGNYKETDLSTAYDLYGKTKFLGEVAYGVGITIRTSIIGHAIAGQKVGLIDWFLSQKTRAKGYTKAVFSGLTTLELTRVILDIVIAKRIRSGLYQIASTPISKYDLLRNVASTYQKDISIEPSEDVIINRSLDGSKFFNLTSYCTPSWSIMLNEMQDDYVRTFN